MGKNRTTNVYIGQNKKHGFGRFLFDFLLGVCTGGVWWAFLLWDFLRNSRR
jgi:hypothetical protein